MGARQGIPAASSPTRPPPEPGWPGRNVAPQLPSMQSMVERIERARAREIPLETPPDPARRLSERLGARVLLKREDLQPVHSFKLRGAYNKIASLSREEAARGLVAASAGNHAQGVGLAAQKLGYHATILMPTTTPDIKIKAVRALGAEVVLHGDTYDDACEEALRVVESRDAVFIHPYDDLDVIAGQGTVAVEILE